MLNEKRHVDIVVISDVHLGTFGSSATELLIYLKSIQPGIIVLNGDIIDIWQFKKRYWPASHMKVIKHLMGWLSEGKKMYYIPGNHDEMIRKFAGFEMGSLRIVNKLVLELDNHKKAWIFHGDVFDVTMQHSKWLVKLGAIGYDLLLLINGLVNFISEKIFKKGKLSLAQKIKSSVKSAVSAVNNFEQTSADIGIMNGFDYVICGHIHQPVIRQINNEHGSIIYLNSGDWVDNITSLEYANGEWSIYRFKDDTALRQIMHASTDDAAETELSNNQLFDNLLNEFNSMKV